MHISWGRKLEGTSHYWAWHATSMGITWITWNNSTNPTCREETRRGQRNNDGEHDLKLIIESTYIYLSRGRNYQEAVTLTRKVLPPSVIYALIHAKERKFLFEEAKNSFFLSLLSPLNWKSVEKKLRKLNYNTIEEKFTPWPHRHRFA